MAAYPYPQRPSYPNTLQVAGDALYKGGELIDQTFDRQQKLRMAIEDMRQKRAAAILAERAAEDKQRQDEFEYQQKKDQADRDAKFRKFAEGDEIAPSYSPDQARTPASPRPSAQDMAALEPDAPGALPAQPVQGDTSWDMLNDATDASIAATPPPRRDRTDDELLRYSLTTGTTKQAKEFAEARKALREKPADAFNDPNLLADYKIRAQDPAFQDIAAGYAVNPQKYGPILQNWALQNGYAGQRWWASELSRMYHQTPQQARTPAFNPQTAAQQKFSQENSIHDDYTKATSKFDTALPAFAKAQQALQRNNPADAYSAVINFVRTLDPQSTVREAEERLARMSASGGILDRWFASVKQNLVGSLSDDIRKNLYEASKGLLQSEFETGYTPARNDARARTLGYPDPTGQAPTLDTLNTIGQGREPKFNELMQKNIFAPMPAAPAPSAPRPAVDPSAHPKAGAVEKLARKILANPKSKPADIAKAKEALRRLGVQ